MAEQPQVGSAMWGGLRPGEVGERRIEVVDKTGWVPRPSVLPALRMALSIVLVVLGAIALIVSVGVWLGGAAAVATASVIAIVVGLLLGMGGEG